MRGNYTPAEKMFLANARAQNSDPGIRARLNADQRASIQNSDRSFTDRLLASPVSPDNGKPVNADAEVNKGRRRARPRKKRAAAGLTGYKSALFASAGLIAASLATTLAGLAAPSSKA